MVCRPPKPVTVKTHTSSGATVKTHCRGKRGGRASAPAGVGVGARKGKLSDAVLKGIGKAPAKKAPAKKKEKMPKELLLSFQQGGKITDAEGKTVKRKERADKGKKKMPKKKAPPVPPRPAGRPGARSYASVAGAKTRVGQTKGRLSGAVAGSLAAARRKKQAQSNPSAGYA